MGFKRPTYTITFPDGHRFYGLEVKTRSVNFEIIMGVQRALASLPESGADVEKVTADESARMIGDIADGFGAALVSWNLEDDDGTPVPASAESIRKEDFALVLSVVMRWLDTVSNVDDDLGKGSPSGPPSQAASIPMVPLS